MKVTGFKPHKGQSELISGVINGPEMFHTAVVSRQWGKTLTMINLIFYYGINNGKSKILVTMPVYSQCLKVFTQIMEYLEPANIVKSANKSDFTIQLINGSTIWFKSSERPDSIRGLSVNYLFVDEAQNVSTNAWQTAILPTLTAAGKKCMITGTPHRKSWFYDMFMLGKSPDHPNYRSYQGKSTDSPYVDPSFIQEQKRTLPPKIFAQEFLAEWQDNEGSVFQNLAGVCVNDRWPDRDRQMRTYGGLDIGNKGDYTVLTIIDELGRVLYIWRDNHLQYSDIISKVITISKQYSLTELLCEVNGVGDPLFEQIRKGYSRSTPLFQTNQTKENIIRRLMGDIEDQSLELPSFSLMPELVNELETYEYEILPSGKIRYTHPPGMHDDIVDSLAMANWSRINAKKGGGLKIGSIR
jgi:hypothetical protein